MLLTNWLRSISSRLRPTRRPQYKRHARSHYRKQAILNQNHRPVTIEVLEDRTLLTSLISIDDVTIVEGDSGTTDAIFTVTRTGTTAGDLNSTISIDYTTQDGTAKVADDDYQALSGSLQFVSDASAVSQTMTVRVEVVGDLFIEENERFSLGISTEAVNTSISNNVGIVTIQNEDTLELGINDISAFENEVFSFDVSLDHVSKSNITFRASSQTGSTANIYETDYTNLNEKLYTIKAGELSTQVTVVVHDDDTRESDETFFVKLSYPQMEGRVFSPDLSISDDTGQATILNDDGLPGSSFRIEATKVTEGDSGTQFLIYDIIRTGETAGDLNFESSVDFHTIEGTATAGEDYLQTSLSVNFTASATETEQVISVEVPILGDSLKELSETIIGQLSNPSNGSILKGNVLILEQSGTIINDDSGFVFQNTYSASPTYANHTFEYAGRILAMDGDVMVVGVPNSDIIDKPDVGAAYVYIKNKQGTPVDDTDDTWDFETLLMPDDRGAYSQFGSSVAISNDTIVVTSTGNSTSKIYIFTRVGDDWKTESPEISAITVEGLLDSTTTSDYGRFVSIYDDTIVVGAPEFNSEGGAAYIFQKTGNDWSAWSTRILNPSSNASSDRFGFEVSISEDIIVVGAYLDREINQSGGAAYIYTKNGNDWISNSPIETKIIASDGKAGDRYGYSVTTNGTEVAIGAKYTDDKGTSSGSVYLYSRNGADWSTLAPYEIEFSGYAQGDKFGDTIALGKDKLIVGAHESDIAGNMRGAAYVISRNGDNWYNSTYTTTMLTIPDEDYAQNARFGEGVAISNGNLAVGAPWIDLDGFNSGGVFVYHETNNSSWELTTHFSPDTSLTKQNSYDAYGEVVAISDNYMVISASRTDYSPPYLGIAYVYARDNQGTPLNQSDDTWELQTTLSSPDPQNVYEFGQSIAIDGNTILISARLTNGRAEVYLFEMNGSDWTTTHPTVTPLLSSVNRDVAWDIGPFSSPVFLKQSIAIQNNTIVIGNRNGNDFPNSPGVAYVYTKNGSNWSDIAPSETILSASDNEAADNFGYAVDIDGDKIVIGAFGHSKNRGAVYLYQKGETGWSSSTETILVGNDIQAQDLFGLAVAIDNHLVAIGAPGESEAGKDAGAVYLFDGLNDWDNPEEFKFIPQDSNLTKQRYFGSAISLDNLKLAVGYATKIPNLSYTSDATGSVYLFDGSSGWNQNRETILTNTNHSEFFQRGFGTSVTIDGNSLLVTELFSFISVEGASYVHNFAIPDSSELVESHTIIPPAPLANEDHIGNAIEVSGDYMVVGAIHSDIAAMDGGAAYVYFRNRQGTPDNEADDTWEYHTILTAFDAEAGDQFGTSIAIDGDTIVIGSLLDDDHGDDCGSAYVYRLINNVWSLEEKLLATDGKEGDQFGISVSIEDSTIVIGARYHDYRGTFFNDDAGAAYVFSRSGSDWTQTNKLTASNQSDQDAFGHDVVIKNNAIYVTGLRASVDDSRSGIGAIYIFLNQDGVWTEQQILGPSDGEYDDWFGYDIHVDGDYLGAISAAENEFKGTVYLFKNNAGTWEFQQKLTPPLANQLDRSAFSIRISGTTLAIGSLLSDGHSTDSGAVFLYQLIGGTWVESQTISATDGVEQDYFGHAVAYSGKQIIVGAPQNDDAGNNVGKIYIFRPYAPLIKIIPVSQKEGDQGETIFTFQVERVGQSAGDLDFESSVDFETADLLATIADHDFEFQSGTITFTADLNVLRQTQTIEITVYGDNIFEDDEQFIVKLSNPSVGTILGSNSAYGWIEEDDHTELGIENIEVSESAGTASIMISLDKPAIGRVSVDYSTADLTAITPGDYTSTSGTITFETGEQSKIIYVPILNDVIIEPDSVFVVNLTNLNAEANDVILSDSQSQVTILDDDQSNLRISDLTVQEDTGIAYVTVSLDCPLPTPVSIDFSTVGQSATQSADFEQLSGTLTFAPGELTKSIPIVITDDEYAEMTETLLINLSNLQTVSSDLILADSQSVLTIANDDIAKVSVDSLTVNEDSGSVLIQVTLDHPVSYTVTVDYATADGSASSVSDFFGKSGTLTFFAGQQTKNISIPILNDNLVEGNESFLFNLTNLQANGYNVDFLNEQAQITIQDDDSASMAISDIAVDEDAGTAFITVTLDKAVGTEVSVDYSTAEQSALGTLDFISSSGTLTFDSGEQSKTIAISLVNTELVELDETFLVNLSHIQANEANIILADDQAVVTIRDDDRANLTIGDITVNESAGTAVITVSLDAPVDSTISVDYSTSDQTASHPDDYLSVSGTLIFNPGDLSQSIIVTIVDSDIFEAHETFQIELANVQNAGRDIILSDDQAVITIQDDEIGEADIHFRVVNQPTSTSITGETDSLPENHNIITEWATYWVEIWVELTSRNDQGVFSVNAELNYNSEYTTAEAIEFGDGFTQNQAGTIHDLSGTITGIYAETTFNDLGTDSPVLFARIRFSPEPEDQVSLDTELQTIGPYDLNFELLNPQVSITGKTPVTVYAGGSPGASIYANPFDLNDDDTINYRDLIFFVGLYNTVPSQSDHERAWFADFNQDDRINYRDLIALVGNYNKSKQDPAGIVYPVNYPDAWNQLLLVDTLNTSSAAAKTLSQFDAESTWEGVIELDSPALSNSQQETLKHIDIQVVDLDGQSLGRAAGSTIYIDINAAGYGWFIDSSLTDNREFSWSGELTLIALPDSNAAGRIDLKTVIQHELGHLLGYEHEANGLMQETLAPGIRLLPDWELNLEFEQDLTVDEADEFFLKIQDETELTPF